MGTAGLPEEVGNQPSRPRLFHFDRKKMKDKGGRR